MDKNTRNVIIVVIIIILGVWGYTEFKSTEPPITTTVTTTIVPGTEYSSFKLTPVTQDTSTALSSATLRVWFDSNFDGMMQYTELDLVTESSGTYTTMRDNYPIGSQYSFWVQVQKSGYDTAYIECFMTGQRNSDGSAKTAVIASGSSLDVIQQDDSVTYAGLMSNIAWDDATDYNYTTNGATGTAKVVTTLSAADKGFSMGIWDGVDYERIYSPLSDEADKKYPYQVKWDEITSGGIAKFYAPNSLCVYMSEQDAIDFGMASSDWDMHYYGVTNRFFFAFESIEWDEFFYKSSDDAAPDVEFSFTFDITAAGTTVATHGVCYWIGAQIEYDDWIEGTLGTAAANKLGTAGDDWDWVA